MSDLVRIGSLATDELEGIKSLGCQAGAGNFSSFEQPVGNPYQVGGGKRFLLTKIGTTGKNEAVEINLGYADTFVDDSAVEPVNPVYLLPAISNAVANQIYEAGVYLEIPEGKYIFMGPVGGEGIVIVQGKEVV